MEYSNKVLVVLKDILHTQQRSINQIYFKSPDFIASITLAGGR